VNKEVHLEPSEFLDMDDEINIQDNQVQGMQLDLDLHKIEILQQRYGWLRNEIVMNLEHRYKLMQFLMALLPVTYSVIVVSKLYFIAFLASILVLIISILFYSENRSIVDKSNYLLILEEYIDSNAKLSINGWETYARDPQMKKARATMTLHITFMLLFFFSYSFYNLIFCLNLPYNDELNSWLSNQHYSLFNVKIIIFLILQVPMFLFMKFFLGGVTDYFKK